MGLCRSRRRSPNQEVRSLSLLSIQRRVLTVIRNDSSEANVSIALQGIGAQQRIILSGTPLQNNLTELWSLLHWLAPTVFTPPTIRPFKEAFDLSLGLYDQGFLKKSQALLELIMLRRTKEGVKGELSVPRREEMTRACFPHHIVLVLTF